MMTIADNEFITLVVDEFGFPYDMVRELAENVRRLTTPTDTPTLRQQRWFDMMDLLLKPNNNIQSLTITTTAGIVELYPEDVYFEMFVNPIERLIIKHNYNKADIKKHLMQGQRDVAFSVVVKFVRDRTFTRIIGKTSPHDNLMRPQIDLIRHDIALIPYQQRLAIARFVLHFELWAKPDHVLKTEDQWNNNPSVDNGHNKYLASQINSRLKTLNV